MRPHRSTALLAACTLVLPAAAQEVIGPWTVGAAPVAATTGGLGASAGWLNVVNAPVTLTEAFSGFSMIDDGFSNLLIGDTIDLDFAPGTLTNRGGDDLVLLDAQFDAPYYRVSTSHDGFVQSILLDPASFVATGLQRNYYSAPGSGPFVADITGATVDLSVLGVPAGTAVSTVRLVADDFGCDPLGVGVLTDPLGTTFCQANPNWTGRAAELVAFGTPSLGVNDVELRCSGLPANSTTFFIVSRTQGFVANPAGSRGNLCLAGAIGRYVGPGEIQNSGSTGNVALGIDLAGIPQPTGPVVGTAGETWNFQAWYRDLAAGMATSNFSTGLAVTLQ